MTTSSTLNEKIRSFTSQEIRLLLDYQMLQPITFQMERILLSTSRDPFPIRPPLRPIMDTYRRNLSQHKKTSKKECGRFFIDLIDELSHDLYLNIKVLLSSDQTDIALDHILCFMEFFGRNLPDDLEFTSVRIQISLKKIGSGLIERYDRSHLLSRSQRHELYIWIFEHKDSPDPITQSFILDLMDFIRSNKLIKEYKKALKHFIDTLKRSSLSFWTLKYQKLLKEYEDNRKAKQRR